MKSFQRTSVRQGMVVLAALLLICLESHVVMAEEFLYAKEGKEYYEGSDGKIFTVDIPSTLTFLRHEGRMTYYRTFDGKEIVAEQFGGLLPGTLPDYDWWYGCSPTSTGMMMGYYDLNGYNGQSYTNLIPGGSAEASSHGVSAPLATAAIASSTHRSDYYVAYENIGNDPCPGCHADNSIAGFMETNKDSASNSDGSTTFIFYTNNSPFTSADVVSNSLQYKSGMYGIGEWVQYAGYNYTALYNQRRYGYNSVAAGFTFDNFKAEIDAGRPVLIHVVGHTMLGVGYTGTSTIYIQDTWDPGPHTMTWGGSYSGMAHTGVTCLTLTGGTSTANSYLLWTQSGGGSTGFNSQFNGDMTGWQAHSGSWSVVSNMYLYTPGQTSLRSTVGYTADFSNFDYQAALFRYGSNSNANALMIRGNPTICSDQNWTSGYQFQYARDGNYGVWVRSGCVATALQSWTYSSAINQVDAWNTLRVYASGSSLYFYINGTLVWSGTDTTFSSGKVGIGMYSDGAAGNSLYVDWATLTVPTSKDSVQHPEISAEQQALNAAANASPTGSPEGHNIEKK